MVLTSNSTLMACQSSNMNTMRSILSFSSAPSAKDHCIFLQFASVSRSPPTNTVETPSGQFGTYLQWGWYALSNCLKYGLCMVSMVFVTTESDRDMSECGSLPFGAWQRETVCHLGVGKVLPYFILTSAECVEVPRTGQRFCSHSWKWVLMGTVIRKEEHISLYYIDCW